MDKIIRYFADNKLLVNIIIISIVILGAISMLGLKQSLYPTASLDNMIVRVIYPGASTKDVELNATIPIERELKQIKGIKDYTSVSAENSAIIFITIDDAEDVKEIKDKVFRELSNVTDISKDVEEVNIMDMNAEEMPVYEIGISAKDGYNVSEKKLNAFIDFLEDNLLKLEEVSEVEIRGNRDREIRINVIPEKMNKFQISLSEIVNSIMKRNIRITGGTLQSSSEKTIVTIGQFKEPMEVKDVIIRSNYEESRVKIEDIAKIEDGFKKNNIEVKVNSKKGITLYVVKKANADIVKTVKSVKKYLKNIENLTPEDIQITMISDYSATIVTLLNVLKSNALIGFLLVFFVLYIFLLDFKTSFWTAFTIPLTIMFTFIFMSIMKYSFNIVTLMGMITVLGMLVDHGIIISEVIYEYKSQGLSSIEAVIRGIKDVAAPVALTIITTIVAFIPMYSIKGLTGKFIYAFPTIVIFCLLASFFDAAFMLPNHLMSTKEHRYLKFLNHRTKKVKWFEKLADIYEKALKTVLKLRYIVVMIFILIFIFTIFISLDKIKNFMLFDDDSADIIYVSLEASAGTSLSSTANNTEIIEDMINEVIEPDELISIKTTAGHHITDDFNHRGYNENWALIEINLVPITERKRNAEKIVNSLREKTKMMNIKEFDKIEYQKITMGPPVGAQVDIKVIGEDNDKLNLVKEEVKDYLRTINGVIDIDDDQKEGREELKIDFDYDKMAKLGINVENVAITVRTAYEGFVASSIQGRDKDLDFRVKIDDSFQKDLAFLENLLIPSERYGRLIKLKEFADFYTQKANIFVVHYKGDNAISITAKIKENTTTPALVTNIVKDNFKDLGVKYPGVYLQYSGEAAETNNTLGDVKTTFIIAVLMIYFVLILLFKSLGEPLIVMITIPFGIIGALLAFVTHNVPLTFLGVIGIIGLTGVVVNDAIVMVDFINKVFREQKGKKDIKNIIAAGAKRRLRPVMLTTLTTVAGLLPTAYGIGGYYDMLVPIALAIAYGLLFATLLTLFFIPALYFVRLDTLNLFKNITGRNK